MKTKLTLIALLALLLSAHAQQLLTTNFNFTGELKSYGWSSLYTDGNINPIKTVSPGLTYTDYVLSNIGNAAKIDSIGQDLKMSFGTPFMQNKITYTAFMLNVNKATLIGDYFFTYTTSNPIEELKTKVYIKSASANFYKIGIAKNNETPVYGNDSFDLNTTSLVVLKYESVIGNDNDVVSLFNFKSGYPTSEPMPLVQINSGTDNDLLKISGVALIQGNDSIAPKLIIDGIRSTNDWSELNKPTKLQLLSLFNPREITTNSVKLIWEKNSSYFDSVYTTLVFIKENNPINIGSPNINASFYIPNPNFLTANSFYENDVNAKCVLNTDSTNITVTGLKQKTSYHAIVYAYNTLNNSYSLVLQTNFTTGTTAPKPLINLTFTATGKTTSRVKWDQQLNYYSNTNYTTVVYVKENAAINNLTTPNTNPSNIINNNDFAGTASAFQNDAAAKCVYKGDGTEVFLTNLTPGKEYFILAFAINDLDSNYSEAIATSDFTNNNGPNSVIAPKWNAYNNTLSEISWEKDGLYNDNDYTTVVYLKQGSAINLGTPNLDASTISANAILGSGSAFQNDTLAYCVYKGDLNKVLINNLVTNTNYYAVVYVINTMDTSYSNPRIINGITKDVPPSNVSNITVTGLTNSTLRINWTKPIDYNNDNYNTIVYVKAGSSIDAQITNRDIRRNTIVSQSMINNKGSKFPSDSNAYAVYMGDTNFVMLYGVNNYTTYQVLVFVVRNQDSTYSLNGATGVGTAAPNLPMPNLYFINQINKVNAVTGAPDSNNLRVALKGLVYQTNQINPYPIGIQFVINDRTGGINVYSSTSTYNYQPQIGDSILVLGKIISMRGLLSLEVDSISLISQFKHLKQPFITTQLNENTENELVEIKRLRFINLNTNERFWSSNLTYQVINDSNQQFNIKLEEKNQLVGSLLPKDKYFHLVGIGGQKSNVTAPYAFTGYYISPRNGNDVRIFEPLSRFYVNNPSAYNNLAINGDTNQTLTIKWGKSIPEATINNPIYALQLDSVNGQFLNANALMLSNNMGTDTTITATYGQIANALALLGLSNGQSKNLRWRVVAKSGVFTQYSDTIYSKFTLGYPASVNTNNSANLLVYPNPTSKELNIQLPENRGNTAQVEITDLTGKVLIAQTFNTLGKNEISLNTEQLVNGIYLIKVLSQNQVFITKIVKE
ncbi:MAG: T9SS type A sorting domain-containing protein [Bacteroidia bacterium]